MDLNYFKGSEGDKINAILAGNGFNNRKPLRAILLWLFNGRFKDITADVMALIENQLCLSVWWLISCC
ncbi:hypothetical protein GSUET_08870 [Geobacter sulfurreducens subsp. ethanolicus]|nr:hypothetical protein GSUET_08870 [Geobacter sulfurreducens subsp. ethanolicus]